MRLYKDSIAKDKVCVSLLQDYACDLEDIASGIQEYADLYNFTYLPYSEIEDDLSRLQVFECSHLIVITLYQDAQSKVEKFTQIAKQFSSMSIGFIYKCEQDMRTANDSINQWKKQFLDRINFLRPNCIDSNNNWSISRQKILDNSVCDTVRIKYNYKRIDRSIPLPEKEYQSVFSHISKLFNQYSLYHRSPSDGFIAMRYRDGFLITATKTNKVSLDIERISFVHGYDRRSNTITFSGKYLPSSDVVEASVVFERSRQTRVLIHTHASDLFTRNEEFKHKIHVKESSYGTYELGEKIADVIDGHLDDFIIIEDHGEMFAMTDISTYADRFENLISQKAQVEY